MDSSVSLEDRIWFLRVCHHVPFALYQALFLNPDGIPEMSVNLHNLTPSKSPEAPDSNTGRYVIESEE